MTAAVKLEKARRAYEVAQAAADQEGQQAAAERQARVDAYDRRLVENYDDAALGQHIAEARAELRAAVAADPALSALARLYAAQLRRAHLRVEVGSAANRLGMNRTFPDRPADRPTPELLMAVIADIGEAINADELDQREAAREAAAAGHEG